MWVVCGWEDRGRWMWVVCGVKGIETVCVGKGKWMR